MKVLNQSQQTTVAQDVQMADTAVSRLVGLLKHEFLPPNAGMIITQCRSIHMFFMRFAIDVIFVDRNYRVVGLVENIGPFRLSPYFWRASCAIELPVGTIVASKTRVGDQLVLEK